MILTYMSSIYTEPITRYQTSETNRETTQTRAIRPKPDGDDHFRPGTPATSGAEVPIVLFKQLRRMVSVPLGKDDGSVFVSFE